MCTSKQAGESEKKNKKHRYVKQLSHLSGFIIIAFHYLDIFIDFNEVKHFEVVSKEKTSSVYFRQCIEVKMLHLIVALFLTVLKEKYSL